MTAAEGQDWRLIPEHSHSGAMNMALDEVAARTVAEGGPATVRVFRWEPSTLSLGYRQSPDSIDWGFCDAQGIEVTRRPTGGGGIYHDIGDISYSIVTHADSVSGELLESYHQLCEPVFDAFERMGIDARFATEAKPGLHQPSCYLRDRDPAHDVVVDGSKISGNAQHRQREAIIQHGSLSYDLDIENELGVFGQPVSRDAYADHVTSISTETDCERVAAVSALESALSEWATATVESWTTAELDSAQELVDQTFGSDDWILNREKQGR